MDFEFSMIHKTSMVVISGAISNSLDKCKIRKLEGRPLLLPLHEQVRQMREHELLLAKREIKRIFRCKEVLREACLTQLDKSLRSKLNNLNPEFIRNYVNKGEGKKIVVLWKGASDRNILSRLDLDIFQILNITCYDRNFNRTFSIILEKLVNKEVIFELEVGKYEKNRQTIKFRRNP
jgi:hypothetical protein